MSVDRISLDANILFYAVDSDAGERHERATTPAPWAPCPVEGGVRRRA